MAFTRDGRLALILLALLMASGCAIADRMSGVSEAKRLGAIGLPADATVLEIWDTGITVNDDPVVGLRVRVEPPEGDAYETVIPKSLISRVHVPQFQPGAHVPVRIDPADRARVALAVYNY